MSSSKCVSRYSAAEQKQKCKNRDFDQCEIIMRDNHNSSIHNRSSRTCLTFSGTGDSSEDMYDIQTRRQKLRERERKGREGGRERIVICH